jgi:hypothetical protein
VSNISDDPYLADMINSFHPGKATLKPISHMDHYMMKADSMATAIQKTNHQEFEPAVLDTIKSWANDVLWLRQKAGS